jgi:hypothetical protein
MTEQEQQSPAEQAQEASGSPVPAGTQVSPSADASRRTQDVLGNPVDEPLGETVAEQAPAPEAEQAGAAQAFPSGEPPRPEPMEQ